MVFADNRVFAKAVLRLSNYEKRKRKNCRILFGNMIYEHGIHIFSFFRPKKRKTKNEKNPRSKLRFFKTGFDFEIPTLMRNCRNFNSNSHKFYEKPWVKKNSRNLKVVIPLSQTLYYDFQITRNENEKIVVFFLGI